MKVGIAGGGSAIAREFMSLSSGAANLTEIARPAGLPLDCARYLFCTGYLAGKSIREATRLETDVTFEANFVEIAKACDRIFDANPSARVCIIGSESGYRGSFDMAYAGAKAAMHLYIETKKLTEPGQMIVGLAPHIIADGAMTTRRTDLQETIERGKTTRLGRWLNAKEVATMAYDVLFRWPTSLSGQVVRMRCE